MKCFVLKLTFVLLGLHGIAFAQTAVDVYPSSWWAGMKNPNLQLMVHGKDVANLIPTFKMGAAGMKVADGITMKAKRVVENPNYVFLDLVIDKNAKPGKRILNIPSRDNSVKIALEIKARRKGNGTAYAQGVRSEDFIYLIMPDRFSNGDPSNDQVAGYRDQSLNRDSMYHRHGGDLQGVINHLDYLRDLGVTTVWLTPVLENDMPNRTEHGYAVTNDYQVDKRLGGDEAYRKLSDAIHQKGMKLIQDVVYNHVGIMHFTVVDPPMADWLHQWPQFTQTTYKDQPLFDPHGAPEDQKELVDGWFTQQMPDLNQKNPYVANFLIQHAIWSVEEFGVDGWRIDTYIYNDLEFMNRCNKALLDEYPRLTMFGETWVHGTAAQAYFARNHYRDIPFHSNLIGVTDFQANLYGINPALNQPFGWTEGVNRLYQTLSNDFLYENPMTNVIFLDNHDMTRFYSQVNEDADKLKMGIGWLLTCRGIPQMYYGTEVLLKGVSNPDGLVRGDFLGGWKGDASNKFASSGRTQKENEIFFWTRSIARFRQNSEALKTGKLMQYVPQDGVYTYFRYTANQTIMIVMNTSSDEKTVHPQRFKTAIGNFGWARDIISAESKDLEQDFTIPGHTIKILELSK